MDLKASLIVPYERGWQNLVNAIDLSSIGENPCGFKSHFS